MRLRESFNEYFYDYYLGHHRRRVLVGVMIATAVGVAAIVTILVLMNRDTSGSAVGTSSTASVSLAESVPTTPATESANSVAATTSTESVAQSTEPVGDTTSTTDGGTSTTRPDLDATTTTAIEGGTPVETGPIATLPDGDAVPVVAVFDTDTITLTGAVPNQAAVDRLTVLAVANSQTPAKVQNNLVINAGVPINVGVRVIELNSVRFPSASADVLPEHAMELDRVAAVMKALPNVSVLVIGHSDQRGTETANFAISDARARAVVNYLISVGVQADRLSSRAVGATDLLMIDNDEASLALNRRTEFIFYGLLIE